MADFHRVARIQQALLICACGLWASASHTLDYESLPPACLLATADAVVRVRLPVESATPFTVAVEEVIAGMLPAKTLPVYEPAPWRGEAPVFFTREALLFVRHNPGNRHWEVTGPSGEGRVQLDKRNAYTNGIAVPGARWGVYEFSSGKFYTAASSRQTLLEAFGEVGRCFAFGKKDKLIFPQAHCEPAELDRLRARSALHADLLDSLRRAQIDGLRCLF